MSLKDINEDLYKTKSDIQKRYHEENRFDPFLAEGNPEELSKEEEWKALRKGLSPRLRKIIRIVSIVAGAAIITYLGYLGYKWIKDSSFSDTKVIIEMSGPTEIDSSKTASYIIKYNNNNRIAIKDAEIILNHSDNFQPEENAKLEPAGYGSSRIKLGEIKGHGQGELELKGKFYAPQDYIIYMKTLLNYTPGNFNSPFQAQNQIAVKVKASPLELRVDAPREAASGENVEYNIDYKNLSIRSFGDLRVKVEYPDGFEFKEADPVPTEGKEIWYVGNLDLNQSGHITIKGIMTGIKDEAKIIKVSLGNLGSDGIFTNYSQKEEITKIKSLPLSIVQRTEGTTDNVTNPGGRVYYILNYKNEGDVGLRDVIITLEIKTNVLDFSKLELDNGSYDSSKSTFTWKAGDIPGLKNLEPGQRGEIRVSIPVVNVVPVKNTEDKNFTINSIAKIDSPDIPTPLGSNKTIASSQLSVKLNSKVILEAKGYYNDANIKNSGPIPPQVGEETTYTLHWLITNVSNDISNTQVTAFLPTGVKWKGKTYPNSENINYNERTNEITWQVGRLDNGVGILNSPREVSFQIGITPESNQVKKILTILNVSTLTAKDLFTTKDINVEIKEKNTQLKEDEGIPSSGYMVQETE
jgi:hypothetical protein